MPRRISLKKRTNTKSAPVEKIPTTSSAEKRQKEKFKLNLKSYKLWTSVMLIAGVAMLGASGYIWWTKIFTNEDRIFYGMIEKSLEIDSVSRQVETDSGTRSDKQDYFVSFTPTPLVQTKSSVQQIDQSRETSTVNTETIGTKDSDFVRYTSITVPPNSQDKTDYSKVINTWANRKAAPEKGQPAQFLNEAIFTFIPFGNFNQNNRAELMQLIRDRNVYQLANDGKVSYDNGRPVYTVSVLIKPRGLIEVLKRYAEITGIGDTASLDPSQYDDKNSFNMQVKIDMLSRHLQTISYPGQDRKENYVAYGLNRNVEIPQNTITIEELQSKLK